MFILKYYWVAFTLKNDNYVFQDKGHQEKTDLEINSEWLRLAQGRFSDNPLRNLEELINHWNRSQTKVPPVLWYYSMTPVDEFKAKEELEALGYL